jgi:hypothetical protein
MDTSTLSSMDTDKVRENRLRRMAERRGLRLEKSRRRDPMAADYGTYQIIDNDTNGIVSIGGGPSPRPRPSSAGGSPSTAPSPARRSTLRPGASSP